MLRKFLSNKYIGKILDDDYDKEDLLFDLFILFFILLSTVVYILHTLNLSLAFSNFLNKLDLGLNILFTIEFVMRIVYSKNLFKHFKSIYTYIDLIAIFPFWIGFGSYSFFRIFRFFRFFRFSKLLDYSSNMNKKNNKFENVFIFKILFSLSLFLYVSSALIYEVEVGINPSIENFSDAVYFMVISVASIGYGDIYPITKIGRLIVMFTGLASIVIIPYHLGNLFKQISSSNKNFYECKNCGFNKHDTDANFCKNCGARLRHEF